MSSMQQASKTQESHNKNKTQNSGKGKPTPKPIPNFPTVKGSQLVGLKYKPQFPYFQNDANAFTVLNGDFVTTEDGTGIVHIAPGFGEDDNALCKKNGIKTKCPVDDGALFEHYIDDIDYDLAGKPTTLTLKGRHVFETNDDVIKYLKGHNLWIKTKQFIHNYPHCWRTDTPLIYKAVNSWYVEVTAIKDKMIANNQKINWIPNHIKDGMFGKWLENTRDWSISRNRFWGCPVPVWQSTNPKYPRIDVYGSAEELKADFAEYYEKQNEGKKLEVTDLHRPFIDSLTRPNPNDPTGESMMVRVEDVLDCWFESGSMPYASVHYPFEYKENGKVVRTAEENQAYFKNNFPADFIVEYVAQTRGWFYTLVVLSTALFNEAPFLNCICHGVILDDKGQKLSKRLKNYPDPKLMFATYGSDAMRFLMAKSSVMKGSEFYIDQDGNAVRDIVKTILYSIWNSFSFLKMYMEVDGIWNTKNKKEKFLNFSSKNIMDVYIMSKTKDLCESVKKHMDAYDSPNACADIERFLESLSNWYIRRTKKRFWGSEMTQDKQDAYNTLYSVMFVFCIISAPLLPCITEKIYLELNS